MSGWLSRLNAGLKKTRDQLARGLSGWQRTDPAQLEMLEETLLAADLGVETAMNVVEAAVKGRDPRQAIVDEITDRLPEFERILPTKPPEVIVLVGINGTGKTTSAARLAHMAMAEGKSVVLAAADTFRAAAADQLEVWGGRLGCDVIRGKEGSDPGAVAFDAAQAALARGSDLLLVDTAGRLHTNKNLMSELAKVVRVLGRVIDGAPHQVLLVIDATTGQNAVQQAREFKGAVGVTGLILTKLDGTARGGSVVTISSELDLPVAFVGVGEQAEDLLPFSAPDFAAALLGN